MMSRTYGEVTFNQAINIIKNSVKSDPHLEHRITIGCDSQNFDDTKRVIVVAVHRVGKGGFFFYETERITRLNDLRTKIYHETHICLEMATKVSEAFINCGENVDVIVHVDIGHNGPTSRMIREIVGWVESLGFPCVIKPDSYAASWIANKLSK